MSTWVYRNCRVLAAGLAVPRAGSFNAVGGGSQACSCAAGGPGRRVLACSGVRSPVSRRRRRRARRPEWVPCRICSGALFHFFWFTAEGTWWFTRLESGSGGLDSWRVALSIHEPGSRCQRPGADLHGRSLASSRTQCLSRRRVKLFAGCGRRDRDG